jgi:hypothetical protein
MQLDGSVVPVLPGTLHGAHPRGFHADVAESFAGARRPLAAEIGIELVGTGELAFAPVGGSTQVSLASDWPHPSFAGRFLPLERQVGETGFSGTLAAQRAGDDGAASGGLRRSGVQPLRRRRRRALGRRRAAGRASRRSASPSWTR